MSPPLNWLVRVAFAAVLGVVLTACGAKTGLLVQHFPHDAEDVIDAPDVVDAAMDVPVDRSDVCVPPALVCPAGVSTTAGVAVSVNAMVTFANHAALAMQLWTILSSPPGSSPALSTSTGDPTMFTADEAGTYNLEYNITDTNGCSATCMVPVTIAPTYRGTEFWAVSTTNSELVGGGAFDFAVAMGNTNDIAVTATVTGGVLTAPLTFMVPPHSAVTQALPWVYALSNNNWSYTGDPLCCDSDCCMSDPICTTTGTGTAASALVSNGAYRIVTTAPVSMYQFNPLQFQTARLCTNPTNSYTNDASLLLPTPALTGNYIVLAHNADGVGSFAAITATHAGTTHVQVLLSTDIVAGPGVAAAAAHTMQTYTLQQGDVVQLVSQSGNGVTFDRWDLTGTVIQADAPVQVFGGVDCTNMSPDGSLAACDHIEQQMFPIETWGRDVVVSQLQDRSPTEAYMVRVLSGAASNQITFNPPIHAPTVLQSGEWVEFESTRDFEVTASGPILVGQYMEGQDATGFGPDGSPAPYGDPAFVLEVPTPQYRQEYTFVVPSTYTASFLNIVVHTGGGFLLDGRPHGGSYEPVPGTNWSVWRGPIQPGSHQVTSTDGSGFALKVIGVAPYTSYMYPGGLDLQTLSP